MVKSHIRGFYNILVEVICFFDQEFGHFLKNNLPIACKIEWRHTLLKWNRGILQQFSSEFQLEKQMTSTINFLSIQNWKCLHEPDFNKTIVQNDFLSSQTWAGILEFQGLLNICE